MSRKKFEIIKQQILPGFEAGRYEPSRVIDRNEFSTRSIENNMRRDNRVNIRVSGNDLLELQHMALKEGLPVQTLLASIIHKYATGLLREDNKPKVPETTSRPGSPERPKPPGVDPV